MKKVLIVLLILGQVSFSGEITEESQNTCAPAACYYLENIYSEGNGVIQDQKEATKFYRKACNGGNVKSSYVVCMTRG